MVPFGGFELLREERPDAAFKGEDMQGSTTMFVDFSLMSTSPPSVPTPGTCRVPTAVHASWFTQRSFFNV